MGLGEASKADFWNSRCVKTSLVDLSPAALKASSVAALWMAMKLTIFLRISDP